ncbi:cytochrome P450 [Paxillus ammoniavirescens]|nr:cytochrome P450 [Paxillus ammoniavirescens]
MVQVSHTLKLMQLQVPALSDGIQGASGPGLAGIAVAAFAVAFVAVKLSKRPNLDAIPTVGSSTWLGSWWAGIQFLTKGADVVREGYEKHKGTPFKVADMHRWKVVLSGRHFVEDVSKASDDELSLAEAANDEFKVKYTLGHDVYHNPYHVPIIRSQLTRNVGILYPDIRDEMVTAFEEILDLRGNEWKSVPAFQAIQKVVSRTSNRIFVGLPLCRNPDWIDLNERFALDVAKGAVLIGLFPKVLAPLVARYMTSVPGSTRRAMKHLGPIIEVRRKHIEEYGKDWADKPNDFLTWLMDHPDGSQGSVKELTLRILSLNFAGLHTTSISFAQVLYDLAANPQYMHPLREEVEAIVETDGWSKEALGKMRKLDSFLKESQRMDGISCVSMSRKAMKDFTLSDGTVLPQGTIVTIASQATRLDNGYYENADVFDPFRFANMREEDGDDAKHSFASTNPEYLAFAHGRHACPGRFFVATALKSMLAHVVLSYDIKLEDNATRPRSWSMGVHIVAHPTAKVVFRKRAH